MWVIFLVARTVPPGFFDQGPKLRVVILAIGDWPEMAKIRDESGNGNFFNGSAGYIADTPFWRKKRTFKTKIEFWYQLSKFWGQNYTLSSHVAH